MEKCIACGGDLYRESLYEFQNMPQGAQVMPRAQELKDDNSMSFKLMQCKYCGLVQLSVDPILYYRNAIRVGNMTKTMVELRRKEFQLLIDQYGMAGKNVIEIGCSTGEYVALMSEYGIKAYGLEHSVDSCRIAEAKGVSVFHGYIEDANYQISDFCFDGFVCYNFLEHQPRPLEFMRGIYHNLCEDAYGIITVPSFDYMMENSGLYEVIRDHISYFTKDTFQAVLYQGGFEVLDVSIINHDTLCAIVHKKSLHNLENQRKIYRELIGSINDFVQNSLKNKERIAVWGASHQCFTVLAESDLGKHIEYIIDSSPIKQGRYSPVTHVQIVDPAFAFSKRVDSIIIMAPGYAKEIKETIISLYGKDIKIAVLFADKLLVEE